MTASPDARAADPAPVDDPQALRAWIGRSERMEDTLVPRQARLMQATLDIEPDLTEGDPLPPFWHYLYFNAEVPASRLKEDGHEKLGRFLPPVPYPQRMWAGGRVEIARRPRIGERIVKTSTIADVALKEGRSGPLCFVTVDHAFHDAAGALCLTERQNIVYKPRAAPGPSAAPMAPDDATRRREMCPDAVMLFRYSALIFYGHRIHYDIDYARDVEGYPALVFHGPLTATLLAGFGAEGREDRLRAIDIRAQAPLFGDAPFLLEARDGPDSTQAWARRPDGRVAMTVALEFAPERPATEDRHR